MDKPTDEQIKEFWEWCGLVQNHFGNWGVPNKDGILDIITGTKELPAIDLNNLFKYAVPKVRELLDKDGFVVRLMMDMGSLHKCNGFVAVVMDWQHHQVAWGKDPALALFWAIYKVMK